MIKTKKNYSCGCGMNFGNRKDNYNAHINRINPCEALLKLQHQTTQLITQNTQNTQTTQTTKTTKSNIQDIKQIPLCIEIKPINIIDKKQLEYGCEYCQKIFYRKYNLDRHLTTCKIKQSVENKTNKQTENKLLEIDNKVNLILKQNEELSNKNEELSNKNNELRDENEKLKKNIINLIPKNNQLVKIHKSIKKLETTIPANTNLTISNQCMEKIIQKDKEIEEIITQKNKEKEKQFIIVKNNVNKNNNFYDDNFDDIIKEIEVEKTEEKSMTLILDNNIIECRKSDGYINATQLCKAANKHFNDWFRLKSTNEYLISMETKTGIPVLDLINKNIGGEHLGTWIHPKVAINLAQWLSPEFAVQVSNWIYDLMTKGKVETNIKLLKEKDNEIKDKEKRIKHLEQKILKKISTPKYDDSKFVVYLATNEHSEKKRKYTIGLAIDLSKRISNYNKLEDHYPIYYKSFKNEEQMKLAESTVLNKLHDYRMLESKDRFMLPTGKDINCLLKQ